MQGFFRRHPLAQQETIGFIQAFEHPLIGIHAGGALDRLAA